jgi:anti-sigma factor (TIGR02949 family)
MMDCGEVFEKLQDYLDRELSADESQEVERHLAMCGHCAKEYRFEGSFLRYMKKCISEVEIPPGLSELCFSKLTPEA